MCHYNSLSTLWGIGSLIDWWWETQIAKLVPLKTATVTVYTTTVWVYVGPPAGCLDLPCAGTTWWIGTKKKHILAQKQPGRWYWWRGQPWGFTPFFFFFQASHTWKSSFHSVWPGVAKALHTSLLFFFKVTQSSPTLPYHHILTASTVRDRVSTPTWLHFFFFSFLPDLSDLLFGGGANGGSENLFFFFFGLYSSIPYLHRRACFYFSSMYLSFGGLGGLERTFPRSGN